MNNFAQLSLNSLSADPSTAMNLSIDNTRSPDTLCVFWNKSNGERDDYIISLQEFESTITLQEIVIRNASIDHCFHPLVPGVKYSIGIIARAGPYNSSKANDADTTCKCEYGLILELQMTISSLKH